ncbi:MAG: hypothetical protein JW866_01055, partial [Ignavibacteriales bacterium]|nr:hypothetical protein [Ignavibacteriales bacterium]
KNLVLDFYIKNVSPNLKCDLYKEVYVNEEETIEYCTKCLPDSGFKKKYYPFYEPELILWYKNNKIKFDEPPLHNPECSAVFSGDGPLIVSPSKNFEYLLEEGAEQEILLEAASSNEVKTHYWYINHKYLGKSKTGEKLFFKPDKGETTITCMDDKGRSSEVTIIVKYY